ncbi:MAG: calcium-binding protein [Candidatus Zeuxoniibacter abyssi]|nr:MAG: calcium-binding protein [Candidatus Persebacteraceae bacterium AB1(2)]
MDSTLTVKNYYANDAAKIERVELWDGTKVWDAADFANAVLSDAGSGNDTVLSHGGEATDVLDGGNGGNDTLRGGGGGDVYLFGGDSDNDVVDEGYRNFGGLGDTVRLKSGITASQVSLSRDSFNLLISLSDASGTVTDTLTVKNYYVSDAAKIERVELSDGTKVWDTSDFTAVSWTAPAYATGTKIRGGGGHDTLHGEGHLNDVFDGNAGGNDTLRGYGGDDVYWLGAGTGHDQIEEHYRNGGDAGDVIKLKSGIGTGDIRLVRSNNGNHLHVQLLGEVDANGDRAVTDRLIVVNHYIDASAKIERLEFEDGTAWDANDFMLARIRGGGGHDTLHGEGHLNDVFDGNAGGNDILYGYGGDDVYWLGAGTGHDQIHEYYRNSGDAGDEIRIKSGIGVSDIHLVRSNNGNHLHVQLLGEVDANGDRAVTDSLIVENHYIDASAKIERLEFEDGTAWDANDFMLARIRGGGGHDTLHGEGHLNDVFDGNAGGNDILYGYGGDDVYWLGAGTGHDQIHEYYRNSGDAGDEIRIKSGIGVSDIHLVRSNNGNHLHVQLLGEADDDGVRAVTDRLIVVNHYIDASAKIERLEFEDGTAWDANDFMLARIRGGGGNDTLHGKGHLNDVFDGNAGGNDILYGYGGDDVYWLGAGTGHDQIHEYYRNSGDAGDEIRIKSGIGVSDIHLVRSNNGNHLHVQLLGEVDANGDRAVTDSLIVENHYIDASAKIERLEFEDGTAWDANDFMLARIRGGGGHDTLHGEGHLNDVFDGNAGGNDILYGYGGDDVYWLGAGTGHDQIHEYYRNSGDAGDEIRIKSGIGVSDIHLVRSNNGNHLHVQLLGEADDDGVRAVTDRLIVVNHYIDASAKIERLEFEDGTAWDANDFMLARIRGGGGNDTLHGKGHLNDVFDGNAGGNDILYGYGGDDVYWLGAGTGHDQMHEYYRNSGDAGDEIRIKSGIGVSDIHLVRSNNGNHLHVQLLGEADDDGVRAVTDRLIVVNHYIDASAKIERLEFEDGTAWDANDFMLARIRGGGGNDTLHGKGHLNDVFDGNAGGNDILYGYGGDDVYWLGAGTGHDKIEEHYRNGGDAGDEIRIKSGIGVSDIHLVRSNNGNHLHVQLLGEVDANGDRAVTDRLIVVNHYIDASAKIERLEFEDGTAWDANDFMLARIRGGGGNDTLHGKGHLNDVFDGNAGGNDILYGYGGDDVYWLVPGRVMTRYMNTIATAAMRVMRYG